MSNMTGKKKNRLKRKKEPLLLKKILRVFPALLVGVTLVFVGLFIKDLDMPTILPVNNVKVTGALSFLNKAEIKSIVENNISGGYFTVDLQNIREILIQKPWIKNISLRRQWPATLDVFITEQIPVAYWNNDGYISDAGEVFKPEKIDVTLNLPKLNGPEGHHTNVWKFMNMLYQEMALLEYEVVRLDLDERRSWQLLVSANASVEKVEANSHRITVKLGRFETDKRLKRFIRILPSLAAGHRFTGKNFSRKNSTDKILTNKNIKVIDMRYPNGFAVQHNIAQHAAQHNNTQRTKA